MLAVLLCAAGSYCPVSVAAAGQCLGVTDPRVAFLGDSLTLGSPQAGGVAGSWVWPLSGMCSWHDVWNEGRGGTGAIADKNGTSANYISRVSTDVAPLNPNVVFLTSYFNDKTHSPAEVAAAFARTISALQSLPSHPLVVVTGAYDPNGINGAPFTQIDAALLAECTARRVAYIEPRTGDVYDGTGQLRVSGGPWITLANKDEYIGADGIHQSTEGQAYTAKRMFEAIHALS